MAIHNEIKKQEKEQYFKHLRKNINLKGKVVFTEKTTVINSQNNSNKITIGNNSSIKGELLIFKHGGEIHIGDYCYVGEYSRIWSSNRIIIEDHVLISHNVNIHDNDSHPIDATERISQSKLILSRGELIEDGFGVKDAPILLKKNCWIGFNATIMKGVIIGENSIVSAGSIVTKDVPENVILAGIPAQIIKHI